MGKCCGGSEPHDTAFGVAKHRTIKIVIIGDAGVGKTTLLQRFLGMEFNPNVEATVSCDFRFLNIQLAGENFKAQIWDTSGQERFNSLTKNFYRNADAAVVVYSERKRSTFTHLREMWLPQLTQETSSVKRVLIVGNQIDLLREDKDPINGFDMEEICQGYKTTAVHLSAKTSDTELCQKAIDKFCLKVIREKFDMDFAYSGESSGSSSLDLMHVPSASEES